MYYRRKTKFPSFLLLAVVVGGLFVYSVHYVIAQSNEQEATATTTETGDPVADLNAQIEAKKKQVAELQQKADEYQELLQKSTDQAKTLQAEISGIDGQIGQTNFAIAAKEAEIEGLELEMTALQRSIDEKTSQMDVQKVSLTASLKQLDHNARTPLLNMLVLNHNLSEFYSQAQAVASISDSLQDSIGILAGLKEELQGKQNELTKSRDEVAQGKLQLELQKQSIVDQRQLKDTLLADVESSANKYDDYIEQAAREESQANATISALERQVQDKLADGGDEGGFAFNSKGFIWPVRGTLTAYFHDPSYPFRRTIGEHTGLDIGVPQTTPVRAAADGVVSVVQDPGFYYNTAGQKIKSALNFLSICHDENCTVATRYLHLYQINVKPFQFVRQGEIIGLSGGLPGTAGAGAGLSTGPHLHLEFRVNGLPEDPLKYLP